MNEFEEKYGISVSEGTLVLAEKAEKAIERAARLKTMIKSFQEELDSIESPLKGVMFKHNVKSFENDKVKLTMRNGSVRDVIDKEKMKADGVYEKYTYKDQNAPSITIKYKE